MDLLAFAQDLGATIDRETGLTLGARVVERLQGRLAKEVPEERIVTLYRQFISSFDLRRTGVRVRRTHLVADAARGLLRAIIRSEDMMRRGTGSKRMWQSDTEMQTALSLTFGGLLMVLAAATGLPEPQDAPDEAVESVMIPLGIELRTLRWGFRMHDPANVLALAQALHGLSDKAQGDLMARLIRMVGDHAGDVDAETFAAFIRLAGDSGSAVH